VSFVLLDFLSQFWTSHANFNRCAYAERIDQIISCKFLFFSIHDVAFQGTLPTPQALGLDTYSNCFEVNLTKIDFGNGGHCYPTITN
jgi:hypothetical protein